MCEATDQFQKLQTPLRYTISVSVASQSSLQENLWYSIRTAIAQAL